MRDLFMVRPFKLRGILGSDSLQRHEEVTERQEVNLGARNIETQFVLLSLSGNDASEILA